MAKTGKKDSLTTSYQQHELESMAKKWGLLHWGYVAAIKAKLKTNDPNELDEAISELRGGSDELVISHAEMFGDLDLEG